MRVPTPAENNAVEGSRPTSRGTSTVAPKATKRYCTPAKPLRAGLRVVGVEDMNWGSIFLISECKNSCFVLISKSKMPADGREIHRKCRKDGRKKKEVSKMISVVCEIDGSFWQVCRVSCAVFGAGRR